MQPDQRYVKLGDGMGIRCLRLFFGKRCRRAAALGTLLCLFLGNSMGQIELRPLLNIGGETASPSVSPDGKSLAFVWWPSDQDKWGIYIAPMNGGVPALFAGMTYEHGVPLSPRWSPDGKWIAFLRTEASERAALFVKPAAGSEERFLGVVCNDHEAWSADGGSVIAPSPSASPRGGPCQMTAYPIRPGSQSQPIGVPGDSPAVSGDGKTLAFVHGHEIQLLPLTPEGLAAGAVVKLVGEASRISALTWTPDGHDIAYVLLGDRSLVKCVAADPGAAPRDVARVDGELVSLSASQAGKLVGEATVSRSSLWALALRVPGSRPVFRQDLPWNAEVTRVSPDGSKLAYAVPEDAGSAVYLSDLEGNKPRRLFGTGYRVLQLTWSPDGARVAVLAERGRGQPEPSSLFVASTAVGSPRRLMEEFADLYSVTWSRGGKSLFVAANKDGMDGIWRVNLADGSTSQISHGAALELCPSMDDSFLYLLQRPFNLMRLSIGQGTEEQVATGVLRFAVGENELYLVRQDSTPPEAKGVNLYRADLAAGTPEFVANIGFGPAWIQLSPKGRLIYMEGREARQGRIVELQHWHN